MIVSRNCEGIGTSGSGAGHLGLTLRLGSQVALYGVEGAVPQHGADHVVSGEGPVGADAGDHCVTEDEQEEMRHRLGLACNRHRPRVSHLPRVSLRFL